MVTIKDEKSGRESLLTGGARDLCILSDCVLAQMERYNKAYDLCPDDDVRESIKAANVVLRRINEALCNVMPDDK